MTRKSFSTVILFYLTDFQTTGTIVKSGFKLRKLSVKSNPGLLWFCFITLCDSTGAIRCKTKHQSEAISRLGHACFFALSVQLCWHSWHQMTPIMNERPSRVFFETITNKTPVSYNSLPRCYQYSWTPIKRPPIKRPPPVKRPVIKVQELLSVKYCK